MVFIHPLRPGNLRTSAIFLVSACLLIAMGCASRRVSRELVQVDETKKLNPKREYLKVHLKNGNLYVLHSWKIDVTNSTIQGLGNHLDFNRKIIESRRANRDNSKGSGDFQPFHVPFSEIVLVETNDKGINHGVVAMVVAGLITVPISIYCLTNPKSCFGSCPTFYVGHDTVSKLVAEGFSASISPSMEEKDIDVIDFPFKEGDPLKITVKNEALETHAIRSVNLLACEKRPGNRVLQEGGGNFYEIGSLNAPITASHRSRSILPEISKKDKAEWFSLADSNDLATREDVLLEFENPGKEVGLVIDMRQSLITTYLFYHSLSLMGRAAGFYLAEMETRSPWMKKRINRMYDLLGGIEVYVMDQNNRWVRVGTIREAGPIVSDSHLTNLPANLSGTIKVRLRIAAGLWRINMVNLATIERKVIPQRIVADNVYQNEIINREALKILIDPEDYLVTFPGDAYRIEYPATYRKDREYFIESQGYYIEWMREEWLKYEDLKAAKRMLLNPSGFLKKMAPEYKSIEPEMEKVFWNSRYTKIEN